MTQTPAFSSEFAHPLRALAAAALAVLALSGCGSGEQSGSGPQGGAAKGGESTVGAAAPGSEQAAFEEMLNQVAQSCASAGGAGQVPTDGTVERPADRKPNAPGGEPSLAPGASPPDGPVEPGAPTGPGADLNDRDWCASVLHEQRIIETLQGVSEPDPVKVRKALNGLGYIDERIHGLKQEGEKTRFYLDLREKGGQLCEEGLAAGEVTEVTVCPPSAIKAAGGR